MGLRAKKIRDVQHEHFDRAKTCKDDEKTLKLCKHSDNCYHSVSITVRNIGLRISVEVCLYHQSVCIPVIVKLCNVPSVMSRRQLFVSGWTCDALSGGARADLW